MSVISMRICFALCVLGFLCLINVSFAFTASSLHCAMRREINPCTCKCRTSPISPIVVECEKMTSFGQVVDALQDRFGNDSISLKIAVSNLNDLPSKTFQELGLQIVNLKLTKNNLSILHEDVFAGLQNVVDLSFSDNILLDVPSHILRRMPYVELIDLSRNRITSLTADDLKGTPALITLLLVNNNITHIHENAFPPTIRKLHVGFNNLTSLNNSLRGLTDLNWLFLNNNRLKSLEGQLGTLSKLQLLVIEQNQLEALPSDIQLFSQLGSLYANNNRITSLDGLLRGLTKLQVFNMDFNQITMVRRDEFQNLHNLDSISLQNNQITSMNSSLSGLTKLAYLYLSHNQLTEFLLDDIRGLKRLRTVDLSYNKINKFGTRNEGKNQVQGVTNIFELKLQHNEIENLDGALMGIHGLSRLDLSHNKLRTISPDDFIGLDSLKMLDISHNLLTTLEETSKTFLPALEELFVSHNSLTRLDKDFHGLPVLCKADLAHNNIKAINIQLALKTQCQIFGLNSTLRIYLEGNPVLCDDSMRAVIDAMETINNNTKIHGETICQPDSNETSTTTTTTTTTTPEPTPAPTSTTTQRSTTSTTTQTPTTPIQEEYTETITLELPQPVETNNQIPVQDNLEKEKQPDVIRTPDERKRTLDDRVEETRNMPEERLIEEEILNEKVPEDIVSVIDAKIEAEKTPNRIPTAEPVTEIPPRVVNPPIATITKLSPLFSALGPDNVAYVVDNTTDVEFDSISVIKN